MGHKGYPVLSLYADGSTRLDIRDAADNSSLATCTANCVTYCPPDCIIVKDYSENEGIGDALYDAGVVTGTDHTLEAERWGVGYKVMRLNPELAAEAILMKKNYLMEDEETEEEI